MNKDKLLKEELKRHLQLLEYTFYMPETEDEGDTLDPEDKLILGMASLNEQDPLPGDEAGAEEALPIAGEEAPIDVAADPAGEEVAVDAEVDPFGGEEAMEVEDEFATEEPVGGEETVEVDVTDIVDKAEQTRTEIEGITAKMDELMGNLSNLSDQVSGMDQVIDKIENLEKEIEKRNPTPVERLEMRSMDSFPYSIKLTDYWADQEGYDTGEETEDYTLTQQDVDEYSEKDIKQSFDYDENDEDY